MSLHILFFNHICTSLGKHSGLTVFNKPRSDVLYFLEGECCRLQKTGVQHILFGECDYIR